MRVPEAVIFDMDNRCYQLRLAGLSYHRIAKALDCSSSRAWNGVKRSMDRISTKLAEDNRDTHRLQLERLDAIFAQLWPLTMQRKIEKEDGSGSVTVPPSMDAIDRCLKVMERQAKLLGLDTQAITFNTGGGSNNEVTVGPAQKELGEVTPREEAERFMRMLTEVGVMDPTLMTAIKNATGLDIIDAEVITEEVRHDLNDPDADGEPFYGGMPEDPDDSLGEDLM